MAVGAGLFNILHRNFLTAQIIITIKYAHPQENYPV